MFWKTLRSAWLFLGVAMLAVRLAAAPQFVSEPELVDRVIDLLNRRLALMPEVAAVKFRQQLPISDPVREGVVLAQSVADAQAMNLDGPAARAFFSVQIRLARAVQEHCFGRWRTHPDTLPAARDLIAVLRPELDTIGRELLPAVYLASSALTEMRATTLHQRVARLLHQPGATEELIAELTQALGALRITTDVS